MGPPSSAVGTPPEARSRSRIPGWMLVIPLPLATLLLAAVHPVPRAATALVATVCGLAGWGLGSPARLARPARTALGLAAAGWLVGFIALLPVERQARVALQGALGEAVADGLALAGTEAGPLAVDLPAAFEALGWAGAMLTLAAGTAAAARSRRRQLRLAWTVATTACGTVVLGYGQEALGLETILAVTDVPVRQREPAFGTFVNPNHAGTLLAVGACLAGSMLGRTRPGPRLAGGMLALVCLAGVLGTGSRGALLGLLAGGVVVLVVAAPARVVLGAGVFAVLGGSAAMAVGGRDVVEGVTRRLAGPGPTGDPWSGRLEFWTDALDLIATAPILGVGPGGYDLASRWAKTSPRFIVPRHAHMEPLQAIVEWGVPGGLLWVCAALMTLFVGVRSASTMGPGRRRALQAGWLGAATVLFVACLVDFPLRVGALSTLGALVTGVLWASASPSSNRAMRWVQAAVSMAAVAGMLVSFAPLRDAWIPAARIAPGLTQTSEADEARRQARDLHLLELDAPDPWRSKAQTALHDRIRARPLDIQPYLRLAQLELDAGRPDAAHRVLEIATRLQPAMPWPWLGLARAAAESGRLDTARDAWRTGLTLNLPDNDDGRPWVVRALDAGGTAEHWNAVIPDRADRLRDAAVILARRGERASAEGLFARGYALDVRIGVPWARWLLAWGDPQAALDRIEPVEGRDCAALQVRGQALLALERASEAVPWLSEARLACPDTPGLQRAFALARAGAGEAEGIQALEDWLVAHPTDHVARRALIELLQRRGAWSRTAPLIEQLVESGVATEAERAVLPRARLGLPLR